MLVSVRAVRWFLVALIGSPRRSASRQGLLKSLQFFSGGGVGLQTVVVLGRISVRAFSR